MSINIEKAAIQALSELNEMPIDKLVKEVESNINAPLSMILRDMWTLSEESFQYSETQTYGFSEGQLKYASLNESMYKTFKKAANVDPNLVQRIRDAFPDYNTVCSYITDDLISSFAIAGTPNEVITKICQLRDSGMNELTLIISNTERDMALKTLENEVCPSL